MIGPLGYLVRGIALTAMLLVPVAYAKGGDDSPFITPLLLLVVVFPPVMAVIGIIHILLLQ